jgi:alkanesulfonate monooxygenase SsuD/methylene tetrahydromethanopterin reductase-like flavin-dependent oxidoreductase (luciferase family)
LNFGIIFPNAGRYVDPNFVTKLAVVAEEQGFEFFLTWDHYTLPNTNQTFEAIVLLSHIAAKTSRMRIGTCVTPIPFRPPAILAKMVATLDQLSEGRVILGVGAGWHEPEFRSFSKWYDDSTRVAMTKEGVELMIRLWTEKEVNFDGRFYKTKGAVVEPKPFQKPYPELWFGTTGEHMLKLAARYGQGWIPILIDVSEYGRLTSFLRSHLQENSKFSFAYDLYDLVHSREEYLKTIEEFKNAGCRYFAINWKYNKEESIDRIKWFAKEVMPSFV